MTLRSVVSVIEPPERANVLPPLIVILFITSPPAVLSALCVTVALFAITWSVSHGLRREAKLNAFLAEHDTLGHKTGGREPPQRDIQRARNGRRRCEFYYEGRSESRRRRTPTAMRPLPTRNRETGSGTGVASAGCA